MARKDSNISTMEKNKETIKKVSSKVHEELLNTSHLFIDETVATLSRMQRITGKVIKKSEPIIEKQIEITFEAVEALKDQAEKGGKRALKLFGLTKQYNKLSATIAEKVNEIPSTETIIENAKEMVASAKSDVEDTINKASEKIDEASEKVMALANINEKSVAKKAEKIEKKVVAKTKAVKTVAKKTVSNAKTTRKAVATTKAKVAKTVTKKAAPVKAKVAKVTKTVEKKATPARAKVVKKTAPVKQAVAKATATKAAVAKLELTEIKGIGPSLAAIMQDNGIKTIKDLQNASPTALKVVATKAGNRYKSFDTNKWIEAAKATK